MPNFRLTNRAASDFRDIGRYTEKTWGREQRIRYLTMLDRSFHDLAKDPARGRSCDHIREGYRKYNAGRHIVFYHLVDDKLVEIVCVLHERMDIKRHVSKL